MTIDDAVTRQWIRDNRDNIAWKTLGINNVEHFANSLNSHPEHLCELVDDEMGEHTFEDFKARRNDAESVLGLERCAYCHEMVADPIESAKAGGKLCRGCNRWWEASKSEYNPWLEIEWQVWDGRSIIWLEIADKVSKAYEAEQRAREKFWEDLRKSVSRSPAKRRITVQDDDAYDKVVDRKLEHGEDWRNL